MLLPLAGFIMAMLVFGGLAILVSKTGDRFPELGPGPWLRYVGFVCVFAPLGAVLLPSALGMTLGRLFGSHWLVELCLAGGFVLGGCGGAALGLWKASKRVPRE